MDLSKLREPFRPEEIEWRIGRSGEKNGKPWATCLAYVTNRAIQDRLDEVCGPENWQNEFRDAPGGGILCGISIATEHGWVTKWDGAEHTEFEAVKGGLSGAMKRAAVQWGIGRYLYGLDEGFANIHDKGQYWAKNVGKWDPPALPSWALPAGTPQQKKQKPAPVVEDETELDPTLLELGRAVIRRALDSGIDTSEWNDEFAKAVKHNDADSFVRLTRELNDSIKVASKPAVKDLEESLAALGV